MWFLSISENPPPVLWFHSLIVSTSPSMIHRVCSQMLTICITTGHGSQRQPGYLRFNSKAGQEFEVSSISRTECLRIAFLS